MTEKNKIRGYITSFVVFFLALDGILHGLEVISAFYEKAWLTFALTSFHAMIFFLAIYFVGHDHSHHHGDSDSSEDSLNWMKWILPVVIIVLLIMSGAIEELLHAGHDH